MTSPITRAITAGSFRLMGNSPGDVRSGRTTFPPEDELAPVRITDLKVMSTSQADRTVVLAWTAPGGDLDHDTGEWTAQGSGVDFCLLEWFLLKCGCFFFWLTNALFPHTSQNSWLFRNMYFCYIHTYIQEATRRSTIFTVLLLCLLAATCLFAPEENHLVISGE